MYGSLVITHLAPENTLTSSLLEFLMAAFADAIMPPLTASRTATSFSPKPASAKFAMMGLGEDQSVERMAVVS